MVKNRIDSFGFAFKGLGTLLKTQVNARIHLVATIAVIALGIFFNVTSLEWAVLALAIGLVWTAEALNTAIEFLADRVAPERHELIEKAKDTAAAGVLAGAIAAAAAGIFIFLPHIL